GLNGVEKMNNRETDKLKEHYQKVFKENNFTPSNVADYRFSAAIGVMEGNTVNVSPEKTDYFTGFSDERNIIFISLAEYNKQMKTDYKLSSGQALLHTVRCDFGGETLTVGNTDFNIVKKIDNYVELGDINVEVTPILALVVPSYDELKDLDTMYTYTSVTKEKVLTNNYYFGFDNGDLNDEEAIKLYDAIHCSLGDFFADCEEGYSYSSSCFQAEKGDFYTSYGGLFFIGIILSIVFIFAAAIIIYYKQVSEGYEDNARFAIMQKVGMTKSDIKKSINSQILIVFFAPLLFAGLHFGFAFPLIWKILQLFHLRNLPFIILVSLICFAIFGLFYIIIYKLTARAYFSIVSSGKKE
ncbi:MAG: ABC transporter permease, partial [Clostridiales bacterium]|nr:ABC transporter permease [Candidatus Equinaster intestinalis]